MWHFIRQKSPLVVLLLFETTLSLLKKVSWCDFLNQHQVTNSMMALQHYVTWACISYKNLIICFCFIFTFLVFLPKNTHTQFYNAAMASWLRNTSPFFVLLYHLKGAFSNTGIICSTWQEAWGYYKIRCQWEPIWSTSWGNCYFQLYK